jgi:predicted Zn-dependent protease
VGVYEAIQRLMTAHGVPTLEAVHEMAAFAAGDPGNPYAQYALGNLAYRSGQLLLAETAYAQALELDPDRPGMRFTYGHLLRDLGRLDDSERELRLAIEQSTADDDRTRISLAETLTQAGKLKESQAILDAVLVRSPNHLEAIAAQGRLFLANGQPDQAATLLEKAGSGPDPQPWIDLAEGYLRAGRADPAAAAAARALERNPNHPWALAVSGAAAVAQGRRDEGLRTMHRALSAAPRRPEVWRTLARAFEAAGDHATAAQCRRQADAVRTRG